MVESVVEFWVGRCGLWFWMLVVVVEVAFYMWLTRSLLMAVSCVGEK